MTIGDRGYCIRHGYYFGDYCRRCSPDRRTWFISAQEYATAIQAHEPRCSTCLHGPCVGCKHLRDCRAGSKWEPKNSEAQKALEGR